MADLVFKHAGDGFITWQVIATRASAAQNRLAVTERSPGGDLEFLDFQGLARRLSIQHLTEKGQIMEHANEIAQRYMAVWNEADAATRRRLIADVFTDDAHYVDPMAASSGHAALDSLIAAVQQRFAGLRFTADGDADGHHDVVRFSWTLGAAHADPVARGTDVARLAADGRLEHVTGFLDFVAS